MYELTTRALEQAWLFGAEFVLANAATGLRRHGPERLVCMADGREVAARTVIIATGVSWRRLGIASLEALVGTGVFYGAAGPKVGRRTAATSSWSALAAQRVRRRCTLLGGRPR
jgi:thioredoxin reductase (NADPH)